MLSPENGWCYQLIVIIIPTCWCKDMCVSGKWECATYSLINTCWQNYKGYILGCEDRVWGICKWIRLSNRRDLEPWERIPRHFDVLGFSLRATCDVVKGSARAQCLRFITRKNCFLQKFSYWSVDRINQQRIYKGLWKLESHQNMHNSYLFQVRISCRPLW